MAAFERDRAFQSEGVSAFINSKKHYNLKIDGKYDATKGCRGIDRHQFNICQSIQGSG